MIFRRKYEWIAYILKNERKIPNKKSTEIYVNYIYWTEYNDCTNQKHNIVLSNYFPPNNTSAQWTGKSKPNYKAQ